MQTIARAQEEPVGLVNHCIQIHKHLRCFVNLGHWLPGMRKNIISGSVWKKSLACGDQTIPGAILAAGPVHGKEGLFTNLRAQQKPHKRCSKGQPFCPSHRMSSPASIQQGQGNCSCTKNHFHSPLRHHCALLGLGPAMSSPRPKSQPPSALRHPHIVSVPSTCLRLALGAWPLHLAGAAPSGAAPSGAAPGRARSTMALRRRSFLPARVAYLSSRWRGGRQAAMGRGTDRGQMLSISRFFSLQCAQLASSAGGRRGACFYASSLSLSIYIYIAWRSEWLLTDSSHQTPTSLQG